MSGTSPPWESPETLAAATQPGCFVMGTRIATVRGQIAIERLNVGDILMLADGSVQPALWIGQLETQVARHPRPEKVRPVLFRAGSLAETVPLRDLRVSPDHGMLFGDVLVPAGFLVNGATILQEPFWDSIAYWHVETPTHAVLLAEGAPAETYLDDGSRVLFDNAGIAANFIDFAARRDAGLSTTEPCRPVLRDAARTAPFRRHLAARARRLGADTVPDPALVLVVGHEALPFGAAATVSLTPPQAAVARSQGVILASRVALETAEAGAMRGVALAALTLRAGAEALRINGGDPRLRAARGLATGADGLRWTDGQAWLPGSLFAAIPSGALALSVTLANPGPYWRMEDGHGAAARGAAG